MPAAMMGFIIEKGSTFERRCVVVDETGTPMDLSGYTAVMKARRDLTAEPILSLTQDSGDGGQLVIQDNYVEIQIPAEVTTEIPTTGLRVKPVVEQYFVDGGVVVGTPQVLPCALYSLDLISPDGEVTRIIQGDLGISGDVSA